MRSAEAVIVVANAHAPRATRTANAQLFIVSAPQRIRVGSCGFVGKGGGAVFFAGVPVWGGAFAAGAVSVRLAATELDALGTAADSAGVTTGGAVTSRVSSGGAGGGATLAGPDASGARDALIA